MILPRPESSLGFSGGRTRFRRGGYGGATSLHCLLQRERIYSWKRGDSEILVGRTSASTTASTSLAGVSLIVPGAVERRRSSRWSGRLFTYKARHRAAELHHAGLHVSIIAMPPYSLSPRYFFTVEYTSSVIPNQSPLIIPNGYHITQIRGPRHSFKCPLVA